MPLEQYVAFGALFVLLVVGASELMVRRGWLPTPTSRTINHIVFGMAVAVLPHVVDDVTPFYVLAAAVMVLAWIDRRRGRIRSLHGERRDSVGTPAFAAAFLLAGLLCLTMVPNGASVFTASFVVLAVADPLAAAVGRSRRDRPGGHPGKTLAGSAAFFLASAVLIPVTLAITGQGLGRGLAVSAAVAVCASFFAAVAEHASTKGWDNISIVLAVATTLHLGAGPEVTVTVLAVSLVVPIVFVALSYRGGLLELRGALVAGLLGAHLLLLADWRWLVPGLLFFATSSALSRVGSVRKRSAEERLERGHVRDSVQVFANGGMAWAIVLLHSFGPEDYLFWAYAGAFAAATADTWATEIGLLSRSDPRNILSWRRQPAGTSGAVTPVGTLGGAAGAALIGAAAAASAGLPPKATGTAFLVVAAAGLAGSLADTLLGASVQAMYRDSAGRLTERGGGNRLTRGWSFLNNDGVNFAATAVGAAAAAAGALLVAA